MTLFVTTSFRGRKGLEPRAQQVAARIGAPFLPRKKQSLELIRRECGREHAYVVSRQREDVRTRTGRVSVEENLLWLKLRDGLRHPLIRAVRGNDETVGSVFDATLGLAQDALHIAAFSGSQVVGSELSVVTYSLLEEGLERLHRTEGPVSAAAKRVRPIWGNALDVLARMQSKSFDVITYDPMFDAPEPSAGVPGFEIFRWLAHRTPAADVLNEASRVASRRIVMKIPIKALPVDGVPWTRREEGRAVSYLVRDFS